MDNCRFCIHAIFDELWGDYKCAMSKTVIRDTSTAKDCTYYKKKKEEKKNGDI